MARNFGCITPPTYFLLRRLRSCPCADVSRPHIGKTTKMAAPCKKFSPVNLILCGLLVLILAVTNPDNEPDLFESNEINQSSCLWKLNLTFSVLNTQPNRRCRINMKNNVGSCLVFYLLIMQSGDVEMNPGPPKYPCGICSKNVNWNAKAIQCDGCDVWFHARCANIGPESFKALTKLKLHGYATLAAFPTHQHTIA